jgi:Lipase (class 3)
VIFGGRSTLEPVDGLYANLCAKTWGLPGLGDEFACHAEEVAGELTVCFRGTHSWQEWLADLAAIPMPATAVDLFASRLWPVETTSDFRLGEIHAGFLAGAARLMPSVDALLGSGQPFALCGHSLGGALATVVAGFLAVSDRPPSEIVTFGAPRAGKEALAAVLHDIPMRQYRYRADPVPMVPTDPPFMHPRAILQLGPAYGLVVSDHAIGNYQRELCHAAQAPALAVG